MSQARFHVHDSDIDKRIKEYLGFDETVDLGETGRTCKWGGFIGDAPERAEWPLWEVAQRAGILSDDELFDAMMEGLDAYLGINKANFKNKLIVAAEAMRAEMLSEPPYEATR